VAKAATLSFPMSEADLLILEREFAVSAFVRRTEIAVQLLEAGARPSAVATALRNALADYDQANTKFRKIAKGEKRHAVQTSN
jgi:hypothetical protein